MATRSSNSSSTHAREAGSGAADATANGQAAVADLTRQQMANTASTASTVLRLMEQFQQTQHQMLQRAALLQEQTAERLRSATTPVELMAIQSNVLMSGWSELAQYTQQLMLASLKAQNELMRPAQAQAQAATAASDATATSIGTPMPPFSQAWQAWQTMFNMPGTGAGTTH